MGDFDEGQGRQPSFTALPVDGLSACPRFGTDHQRIRGGVRRRGSEGVLQHVQAPSRIPHLPKRSLHGGHAVFHRLNPVVLGEGHAVCGHVHFQMGSSFQSGAEEIFVAVVQSVEGSTKEATRVPSFGGHASRRGAEPFRASAALGEKEGVCPPARTARIITSQLRGLTHVQGLSVQSVGWLGVIRSSSEDPCPITVPLLLR